MSCEIGELGTVVGEDVTPGLGLRPNGRYTKSSFCNTGTCVEVALLESGEVSVRDSKLGEAAATLVFSPGEWGQITKQETALCEAVGKTAVTLTLNDHDTFVQVPKEDGGVYWARSDQNVIHEFTGEEIALWAQGAQGGEFDLLPQLAA